MATIAPYRMPMTDRVTISGANVADASGNNCRQ
jgi:hypothetical protein